MVDPINYPFQGRCQPRLGALETGAAPENEVSKRNPAKLKIKRVFKKLHLLDRGVRITRPLKNTFEKRVSTKEEVNKGPGRGNTYNLCLSYGHT